MGVISRYDSRRKLPLNAFPSASVAAGGLNAGRPSAGPAGGSQIDHRFASFLLLEEPALRDSVLCLDAWFPRVFQKDFTLPLNECQIQRRGPASFTWRVVRPTNSVLPNGLTTLTAEASVAVAVGTTPLEKTDSSRLLQASEASVFGIENPSFRFATMAGERPCMRGCAAAGLLPR